MRNRMGPRTRKFTGPSMPDFTPLGPHSVGKGTLSRNPPPLKVVFDNCPMVGLIHLVDLVSGVTISPLRH
jgi:hypothetical protein